MGLVFPSPIAYPTPILNFVISMVIARARVLFIIERLDYALWSLVDFLLLPIKLPTYPSLSLSELDFSLVLTTLCTIFS
jgi:hypothetical protein